MNLEIGAAASWTNRLLSTPPSTAAPFCGLNGPEGEASMERK